MNLRKALKWSFLAELVVKMVQPLTYVILTHFLTPEDLGVVASAMMVVALAQIFFESGTNKALIQRSKGVVEASNAVFCINIVYGVFVSIGVYFFSGYIADVFFQDLRISEVLSVMCSYIVITSLLSVHLALLQKRFEFGKIFIARCFGIILPSVISLALAIFGYGYWSVVIATIVGQFIQMILLWYYSGYVPSLKMDSLVSKEILTFSSWVTITGLLTWFYMWVDSLVVGMYLGSHDLGLYRTGNILSNLSFLIIFSPIIPVFYSYISKVFGGCDNVDKLRSISEKAVLFLTLVSAPIAVALYINSDLIESVFFGKQWEGIGFVIGVLALMHGLSWVVGLNGEIYRAIGKPKYETIVNVSMLGVYVVGYLISIKISFESFVYTRLILSSIALIFHMYLLKKLLDIKLVFFLKEVIFILLACISVMSFGKYFSYYIFDNEIFELTFSLFCSLILFAMYVFFSKRLVIVRNFVDVFKSR